MKKRKDKNGKIILLRKQYEKLDILLNLPFLISFILFFGSFFLSIITIIVGIQHGFIISLIVFLLSGIGCGALGQIDTSNALSKKYVQEEENAYAYLQQLGYEGEPLKAAGEFLSEFY